ncbi:prolipoprotein diacylglyceryl transferase [Frondihabitans cladoniiphilus]|uniref:Phosphatidylglycerol--prolipoprotein diacylglyceryl transferase n=1 Tax=Frondihabitans cladoniiphilus TaxID=715785 RepID=A0ABP8W4T6_9MICO
MSAGIPSPSINSFDIGPLTVHFYALCILVGIVIAIVLTNGRLKRRGVESGVILDIAIWAVPIGLIGGRLYHVVTHPHDYFYAGANLWNVFAIWEGGLAIFGSILAGTLGAYIGCRRAKVDFVTFADALMPGLLLAQAFGRLGNYFNQELYGSPTTLPWGLQISTSSPAYPAGLPAGTLFQPLFLYEMVWNIIGALLIMALGRRIAFKRGQVLASYLVWYGCARAVLESLRLDPTEFYFLGLKINEDIAILMAIVGVVLFVIQGRRGTVDPVVDPRSAPDASQARADGADGVNGSADDDLAVTSPGSDTSRPD